MTTYEQIVELALNLRKRFEQSEAELFLGLADIESKYMKVLRKHEIRDFDQFLRSYELCRPERYRSFVIGLRHITAEKAREIGAPAVMALSRATSERQGAKYVEAVEAWITQHNGLRPRTETAKRTLQQVDPVAEVPGPIRARDERERLRDEVLTLRQKVARLERENAQLLAKIAVLEAPVVPKGKAGRGVRRPPPS